MRDIFFEFIRACLMAEEAAPSGLEHVRGYLSRLKDEDKRLKEEEGRQQLDALFSRFPVKAKEPSVDAPKTAAARSRKGGKTVYVRIVERPSDRREKTSLSTDEQRLLAETAREAKKNSGLLARRVRQERGTRLKKSIE